MDKIMLFDDWYGKLKSSYYRELPGLSTKDQLDLSEKKGFSLCRIYLERVGPEESLRGADWDLLAIYAAQHRGNWYVILDESITFREFFKSMGRKKTVSKLEAFEDPNHPDNSDRYHTGKPCITKGCNKPAGTWWSPLWCFECNVQRIRRIDSFLDTISAGFKEKR